MTTAPTAQSGAHGQSVGAQVKQLHAAGCEKVFRETASGARSDRAGLRRALDHLGKGDVLMVSGSTGWRDQPAIF
jgi:DNA invertase Pin-like site-specific DNA recombinase